MTTIRRTRAKEVQRRMEERSQEGEDEKNLANLGEDAGNGGQMVLLLIERSRSRDPYTVRDVRESGRSTRLSIQKLLQKLHPMSAP